MYHNYIYSPLIFIQEKLGTSPEEDGDATVVIKDSLVHDEPTSC